ncbi:MAG: L-serine ammonia-lyase, iron-sulfur-dependent, subunit alpha [Clostridiaceae bacterium]|nr:L-serine ammonia-lyase, iron-sulfur-dependent, subunit alpha [Clostridiaceae bacterium]
MIQSFTQLLNTCREKNLTIPEIVLLQENEIMGLTSDEVYEQMEIQLQTMEKSIQNGLAGVRSHSGLTGGDAKKLSDYRKRKKNIMGDLLAAAVNYAIAVNEVNAAMGIICATPTAGSAGVLPGVLMAVRDEFQMSRKDQLNFMLIAGICGMIIGNNASISGAEGGCQAEVGSASAMTAAALTIAAGGSNEMAIEAVAIALKNLLGLSCDPVAGLVEIPCIKRNAIGVSNCFTAAEMALAGINSRIPCDEVVMAMGRIGDMMPEALKETAMGGLAMTPTALKMQAELKEKFE